MEDLITLRQDPSLIRLSMNSLNSIMTQNKWRWNQSYHSLTEEQKVLMVNQESSSLSSVDAMNVRKCRCHQMIRYWCAQLERHREYLITVFSMQCWLNGMRYSLIESTTLTHLKTCSGSAKKLKKEPKSSTLKELTITKLLESSKISFQQSLQQML